MIFKDKKGRQGMMITPPEKSRERKLAEERDKANKVWSAERKARLRVHNAIADERDRVELEQINNEIWD